jgi:hypothetical protein
MAKGDSGDHLMRRFESLSIEVACMVSYMHIANLDHLIPLVKQVLCLVHPHVLLMLSRTCRQFRALLVSPSARHVWIQSIENFSIPSCPEHMNEMAYVALAFEAECSVGRTFSCLFLI